MGFVVLFAMAWLTIFTFYAMDKSLSIAENAFVYLVILTIDINISWIIEEELKLVELTKNGLSYAGYILCRSIVVPMIFVIMFNAVYNAKSTAMAIVSMGTALAIILALNGLMLAYGIFHYKHWTIFYDAIQIVLVQAASFALLWLYRRVVRGEVKVS